ncbi:MbtH protein [Salibacterium salarium]|uniref:MbtH family protein n=1 Tax=Salibacterium salarium TaxID=284579 RepID=UPI0027843994|nr:MbtH family protein [Salibacterium salarium]MDQ0297942.1 MbtH protein [Salibacterium salarium]
MTHPFEKEDILYVVLLNDQGQYSLWPAFLEVPPGWEVVYEQNSRKACIAFVESNWSDMRPNRIKN